MPINDATYTELISIRDKLDARQRVLQLELEDVTKKLNSVSITLALLDSETQAPSQSPDEVDHTDWPPVAALYSSSQGALDVASLKGLTQVEAMTRIARHYDGRIRTSVAKRLLIQAGLISNPKNANNIIFSVIQRSGKFERVEPGVYRLIGDKPTRPEKPIPPEIQF